MAKAGAAFAFTAWRILELDLIETCAEEAMKCFQDNLTRKVIIFFSAPKSRHLPPERRKEKLLSYPNRLALKTHVRSIFVDIIIIFRAEVAI
jgi:hypothetical protein